MAEKEIIIYNLDETGQWYADRVLEQAIGVRNAQQPIDAMNSVQYPSDNINAYATDRTFVAINVASQLTLAISERIQSAPPSKPSLQDEIQYDLTRNYRFEIELEDNALLERTIQVSPSSFSPNIKSIIAFSQYQAMAIKGQSMAITVEMPLADLIIIIFMGYLPKWLRGHYSPPFREYYADGCARTRSASARTTSPPTRRRAM